MLKYSNIKCIAYQKKFGRFFPTILYETYLKIFWEKLNNSYFLWIFTLYFKRILNHYYFHCWDFFSIFIFLMKVCFQAILFDENEIMFLPKQIFGIFSNMIKDKWIISLKKLYFSFASIIGELSLICYQ